VRTFPIRYSPLPNPSLFLQATGVVLLLILLIPARQLPASLSFSASFLFSSTFSSSSPFLRILRRLEKTHNPTSPLLLARPVVLSCHNLSDKNAPLVALSVPFRHFFFTFPSSPFFPKLSLALDVISLQARCLSLRPLVVPKAFSPRTPRPSVLFPVEFLLAFSTPPVKKAWLRTNPNRNFDLRRQYDVLPPSPHSFCLSFLGITPFFRSPPLTPGGLAPAKRRASEGHVIHWSLFLPLL